MLAWFNSPLARSLELVSTQYEDTTPHLTKLPALHFNVLDQAYKILGRLSSSYTCIHPLLHIVFVVFSLVSSDLNNILKPLAANFM